MLADSYVLLGDLRFHYRRCGARGAGPPLVLLHGLASNARIWDLVAPRLGQRREVFALDQRGHGLTDKPDEGYDFQTVGGDLGAFLETLGLERPAVIGHSWGAGVALQYAASRPVGPWAPSAVGLIDGGFTPIRAITGLTWEKAEEMMRPPSLAGMPRERFVERMADFAPDPSLLTPEVVDIVLANFEILPDDTIRPRLTLERHMRIARALFEQETAALYPRVRCPVLLAPAVPPAPRDERAEQFLALKREGVAVAERLLPRSHTQWFEDTTHDVPLYRPARLAEVIEGFVEQATKESGK